MRLLPVLLKGTGLIVVLTVIALLLGDLIDRHWVDVYVRGQGMTGEVLFVTAAGLLISAGASRQLVAFLAGYGFGFTNGLLLSMLAAIAGCILTFALTRGVLRGFLQRNTPARLQGLVAFIRDNTFTMTLLLRVLPVGSNFLVNLAAGASSVRPLPFLLGSALGYLPQMVVFALAGSGSQLREIWQLGLAIAMFVLATLLAGWLLSRYRRQQLAAGSEPRHA
jgi:uncharacterized membrane protein YdjX (TVP38/TMEM64 family)